MAQELLLEAACSGVCHRLFSGSSVFLSSLMLSGNKAV
jgi:hypothetical protein